MSVSAHERTNSLTHAEQATRLQATAAESPEYRGTLWIEAACAWRRAGQPDRAARLLNELIAAGGEDGCYARTQRIEFLIDDRNWPQAETELAVLAREADLHETHCTLIAELLLAHDQLTGAARWYDRALTRLTPDVLAQLRGPRGWAQLAAVVMLRGRKDLRARLGLPPDAGDELIAGVDQAWLPRTDAPDLDTVAEHLAAGGIPPRGLRLLVFQRDQRAHARERWPQAYPEPDTQYYPAAEARWRHLAQHGAHNIQIVPATVAALDAFAQRAGTDPTDSTTKTRYIQTVPDTAMIPWPPRRNAPCWCGSGAKYKKCCGQLHPS